MDVAILYSGGKDSTFAIDFAMQKGWDIKYLLSVKPNRTDCFLFHYATVEHAKALAGILGIKHFQKKCTVADPKKEAQIVKELVEKNPVDAVVLGGTGLQETQIRSIQEALQPLHVEAFAAHAGFEHDLLVEEMIKKGYKFMITQIASDGLNEEWLGRTLDEDSFEELRKRSMKYGFHVGGEGGYYDTFVVDGPIFNKRIQILEMSKNMESDCVGHVVISELKVVDKTEINTRKKIIS